MRNIRERYVDELSRLHKMARESGLEHAAAFVLLAADLTTTNSLGVMLERIIRMTENALANGMGEVAYDYVFGQSRGIEPLLEHYVGRVEYYGPDTTYEADAEAKLGQLREYRRRLQALQDLATDKELLS